MPSDRWWVLVSFLLRGFVSISKFFCPSGNSGLGRCTADPYFWYRMSGRGGNTSVESLNLQVRTWRYLDDLQVALQVAQV